MVIPEAKEVNRIIKIIKNSKNSLTEFQNYIEENDVEIENLKFININNRYYNDNDILLECIKNNVSVDIIEFIIKRARYNILNYKIGNDTSIGNETPLSLAIIKKNFKLAECLMKYGADIHFKPMDINDYNFKFLLKNGYPLPEDTINKLIESHNNKVFSYILKYNTLGNRFILNILLKHFKNKEPLSDIAFKLILQKELNKVPYNIQRYKLALNKENFEAIEFLYKYDPRPENIKEYDLFSAVKDCNNCNSKIKFIEKIQNNEFEFYMDKHYQMDLIKSKPNKRLPSLEEEKVMKEFIMNNKNMELKHYIKEKNLLSDFIFHSDIFDKCFIYNKLFELIINNKISIEVSKFFFNHLAYDTSLLYNYVSINGKFLTFLCHLCFNHKFYIMDIVLKKDKDIIKRYNDDLLLLLYKNHRLSSNLLIYLVTHGAKVIPYLIFSLIEDSKNQLLNLAFHLYYNVTPFILKILVNHYKNRIPLSNQELNQYLKRKDFKNTIIDVNLYKKAINSTNFEALDIIYKYDYRDKNIILSELFHLFDPLDNENENNNNNNNNNNNININKTDIIENILSHHYLDFDDYYWTNLLESEKIKLKIINYINENNISELDNYINDNKIKLSYFTCNDFDFLIYAIKNDSSLKMIEYLGSQYPSLDYPVKIFNNIISNQNHHHHHHNNNYNSYNYKSPLCFSIANKKFIIAKLLLEIGADINYRFKTIDIATNLYHNGYLNNNNSNIIEFLFNHGFHSISKFIGELIIDYQNEMVKKILYDYIYDTNLCKNLLVSLYKNRQAITNQELKKSIKNEISHRIPDLYEIYYKAICYNNNEIIEFLLDIDQDNFTSSFSFYQFSDLLDEAMENRNYKFIDRLFNTGNTYSFDLIFFFENYFSEQYFSQSKCSDQNVKSIVYIFKKLFNNPYFDVRKINFGRFYQNFYIFKNNDLMDQLFHIWFNHPRFDESHFNLEILFDILGRENWYEITEEKILIKNIIKLPKLNLNTLDVNRLLLQLSTKLYYDPIFMNDIFQSIFSNKTFTTKLITFEDLIYITSQLFIPFDYSPDSYDMDNCNYPYQRYDECVHLMKFVIEQYLDHPSLDITKINIEKVLRIFMLLDKSSSLETIKLFFTHLLQRDEFNMQFISMSEIINALSDIKNEAFVKCIIKDLINHKSFSFTRFIDLRKCFEDAKNIKNYIFFKFYIKCLFHHQTFIFNPLTIENVLLASCRIKSKYYIDVVFNQILNPKGNNIKKIKINMINFEKIMILANRLDNITIIKEIHQRLLKELRSKETSSLYEMINYENILLSASKIENRQIMRFIIENIFNLSLMDEEDNNTGNNSNEVNDNKKPDIKIIKSFDKSYLSLIINVLIKLHQYKLIRNLFYNRKIRSKVDLNQEDKNGELSLEIITSLTYPHHNKDNNYCNSEEKDLELYKYLINRGFKIQIKNRKPNYLFTLALKNKKYLLIKYLLSEDNMIYPFNENGEIDNNTSLMNAIYNNNKDLVENIIEKEIVNKYTMDPNHINRINQNIMNGFTPLIYSFLLNYHEIYNYLINFSDINILDEYGYNILYYALLKENIDMVNYLIRKGSDIYGRKNRIKNLESPLGITLSLKNRELFSIVFYNMKKGFADKGINHGDDESIFIIIFKQNNFTIEEKCEWIENLIQNNKSNNETVFDDLDIHSTLVYSIKNNLSSKVIEIFINYKIECFSDEIVKCIIYFDRIDMFKLLVPKFSEVVWNKNNNISLFDYAFEEEATNILTYLLNIDLYNEIKITTKMIKKVIQNNHLDLLKILWPLFINNSTKDVINENCILIWAIENNNANLLEYLISEGINLKIINYNIIKMAIDTDNFKILQLLIPYYLKNNQRNIQKNKDILIYAIKKNKKNSIQYLINQNINSKNMGLNILINVIRNNYNNIENVLRIFIENHIDIIFGSSNYDKDLRSLFHHAIDLRNYKCMKYLIENGIDINELCSNEYPLLFACKNIHKKYYCSLVRFLVKNNANVNIEDKSYSTALFEICSHMYPVEIIDEIIDLLKFFVEHGADINFKNDKNETYLMKSIESNNIKIVKFLIENGIDINAKNSQGKTALMISVKHRNEEIIKYLMEHGAIFGSYDTEFPEINLSSAIINDDETMIKKIIKLNKEKNFNFSLPLQFAIRKGNINVVKILRNSGFSNGIYDFIIAIRYRQTKIVKYLIDIGENVNIIFNNDECPLLYAIDYGNTQILKLIIEAGADFEFDGIEHDYYTPLMIRREIGKIKCLIEHQININEPLKYTNDLPISIEMFINNIE